ncbi:galectin 17 [Brachyistius frenatus]|uniref:galectin 17 n=1 Tax=Brachyistius frenatus TaxID=100188 RepID=UPI0037E71E26
MKTIHIFFWFFIHQQCFLIGLLVDSSHLSSASESPPVTVTAGNRAVLPCSWKSVLAEATPSVCHVQWAKRADTVFERRGEVRWEADGFEDRVEVPWEELGSGNCSLIISDVQIGDAGRYESFVVVDGTRSQRRRVFIRSVKLFVFDHKSHESRRPGEDLVLQLHTSHSYRVVFQARNSSEWSDVWMRDNKNTQHLWKHPLLNQLTIKNVKGSAEGTYKVLDEQGRAVSTVQLSVEENSTDRRIQQMIRSVPTGDAARSSYSLVLLPAVLVSVYQMFPLL